MNASLRFFPLILTLLTATVHAAPHEDAIDWHDGRELTLEGQAWSTTAAPFDRLPKKAEAVVRAPVWSLSHHSAGLCLRFSSDAPQIHARWSLTGENLAMPHMAATGVSGVDLYVRHEGHWRWLGTGKPTKRQGNVAQLARGLTKEWRDYMLYLPLYNGTSSVEIGLPTGSRIKAAAPRPRDQRAPIVFYGTSITQGACASRPGMTHPAILGRRLERAVINLGFSGNGRMEAELGELLAEIDAAAFVIDCLPNMNGEQVAERTFPLVEKLRKARPKTPILLVEDRSYGSAYLEQAARLRNESSREALRGAHEALIAAGVSGLFYLRGDELVGQDGDGLVDGSHPSDLGFMRQANAFEEPLRRMLAP